MSVALHTEKLGKIAELNPRLVESLEGDALVSFVPMSAVTAETASTTAGEERCYSEVSKGYTPFRNGDVLVAKITPCFENGKIAQATLTHRLGFGSTEFHVVRPRAGKADARYLLHFLRQDRIRRDGEGKMTGSAGQRRVPEHFLTGLDIPLPPLPEQRRIAEVLDRAEALRVKRRAALAQLDTLAQSIFLDLFGDPATNPKRWPAQSLGGVAREKPNNGIFRKNPEYVQDGKTGLPVVWVEELFRGSSIDTRESRRVAPTKAEVSKYGLNYGDLLFCRSSLKLDGIAFNNVYLGEDNATLFECHLIRVQPDLSVISPIYLNCLLRLPQMRAIAKSKSKTATMTTIDQTSLCSIPVMLPPLALQQDFARRIAAVEKLKTAHRASLAELNALFSALQHRAFRGEL